jgi:hypothetical protein
MSEKQYSVLFYVGENSIYEFVSAPNPVAAIQAAVELHGYAPEDLDNVELVIEGHHADLKNF